MKKLTPLQYNSLLAFIREAVETFNRFWHTDLAVEPQPNSCGLCIYLSTKAERWAVKMARRARAAANHGQLTIELREQVTAVFLHESHATGIAICSPKDSYNADLGIAIAYCRATGTFIPDYVL